MCTGYVYIFYCFLLFGSIIGFCGTNAILIIGLIFYLNFITYAIFLSENILELQCQVLVEDVFPYSIAGEWWLTIAYMICKVNKLSTLPRIPVA